MALTVREIKAIRISLDDVESALRVCLGVDTSHDGEK